MSDLTPEEIGIRLALQRVVKIAGARNVALALGCDEGRVSRLQSTSDLESVQRERRHLKAAELSILDRLVGAPIMATEVSGQSGYSVTGKVEQGVAVEGAAAHLGCFAKEIGEAIAAFAEAVRSGNLSISKAINTHKELQDVIDAARAAQDEFERVIAGNKPSQVLKAVQG